MGESHRASTSANWIKDNGFSLDYRKLWSDFLRFWWLYLITLPVSYLVVEILHRYSVPVYSASMTVIVDERGETDSKTSMMEGFGLTPGMRNVDNQIAVLSSWDMVRHTIEQLDFAITYYAEGRLKSTELYRSGPIEVVMDSTHQQLIHVPMYVKMVDPDHYQLKISVEQGGTYCYATRTGGGGGGKIDFSGTFAFGEPVITPWAAFSVLRKTLFSSDQEIYFVFNHPETLTSQYKRALNVFKPNENSSIIGLYVSGVNNEKNIVFLNQLARVFIEINLNQKNKIASNTISFIESQLVNISDSLRNVGSELSQFRTNHKIQSVSSKADYLFSELQRIETEIGTLKLNKGYYQYLIRYFSADSLSNKVLAPALFDTRSTILGQQISQLIDLNAERLALKDTYGQPGSPVGMELNIKFQIAKNTLLQSVQSHMNMLESDLDQLMVLKQRTESDLYALPETERQMLGIERKFELNNEVYTFLLRKRSESQIQKASNTSDHKILEAPRFSGQVSPNTAGNRKKALLAGFLLPLAFIVLRQLLNQRIQGIEDIHKITAIPILGQIVHHKRNVSDVVIQFPKSVVAETFRRVRTRLEFLTATHANPIIAVSSSMPGEGKTFCALNIASVYALSGKRTALLGFDLRRPGLNKISDFAKTEGISNYLIGQVSLDQIISTTDQENLYILASGAIPPNPAELIAGASTARFLEELRKQFDVIVVDTPPMGIVSDAYLLARMADVLVFLVRDNYTVKEVFSQSVSSIQEEGISQVTILLNDQILQKPGYGYRYGKGYHYHYGYQSGYYEE